MHRGIPVTTVARTLADLAHELSLDDLARTLREAQFLKLYDLRRIHDALTRRPAKKLRTCSRRSSASASWRTAS